MADILQITVPTGQPALCWPARSDPTVTSLLFINQDLVNTIYLGQSSNFTAGGPNCIPIPPNGTFSGDPSSAWYVVGSVAGISPVVRVPNGQGYFRGLTQAAGQLALPVFQSPDYVPGTTGWAVFQNGNAEFNNLTVRGTFVGADWIQNASGQFLYDGTPAAGNLICSITPAAGTDGETNQYLKNFTVYDNVDGLATNISKNAINVYSGSLATGWPTLVHTIEFSSSNLLMQSTGQMLLNSQGSIGVASVNFAINGGVIADVSSTGLAVSNAAQIPVVQVGTDVQFNGQGVAPAGIAGIGIHYANANGHNKAKAGVDGNVYGMERASSNAFSFQLINSTSFSTISGVFNILSGQRYSYYAKVIYTGSQSAGNPILSFNHPAGSFSSVDAHEEWSVSGSAPVLTNTDTSFLDIPGPTLSSGKFCYKSEGFFVSTSTQTFQLSAACSNAADTWTVLSVIMFLEPLS